MFYLFMCYCVLLFSFGLVINIVFLLVCRLMLGFVRDQLSAVYEGLLRVFFLEEIAWPVVVL